jgi:hypothetical protein
MTILDSQQPIQDTVSETIADALCQPKDLLIGCNTRGDIEYVEVEGSGRLFPKFWIGIDAEVELEFRIVSQRKLAPEGVLEHLIPEPA